MKFGIDSVLTQRWLIAVALIASVVVGCDSPSAPAGKKSEATPPAATGGAGTGGAPEKSPGSKQGAQTDKQGAAQQPSGGNGAESEKKAEAQPVTPPQKSDVKEDSAPPQEKTEMSEKKVGTPEVGSVVRPAEGAKEPAAEVPGSAAPTEMDPSDPRYIVTDSQLPPADAAWQRLHPEYEIWVDAAKREVIVAGEICLRFGQLEMFACPRLTKEHESVVSVNSQSSLIHAALLALDINPGHPVRYEPEYQVAEGPKLDIIVKWQNADGAVVERRSQEMIRSFRTKEEMSLPWVFAGSSFFEDPVSGAQVYRGNGGQMVCVSNFTDAMIDIPVESSASAANLVYEANTEKIPPIGTRVYLTFRPVAEKPADGQ